MMLTITSNLIISLHLLELNYIRFNYGSIFDQCLFPQQICGFLTFYIIKNRKIDESQLTTYFES